MATIPNNKKWRPAKRDVMRFSEGDCHFLAIELSALTGWPIYVFGDKGSEWSNHAFIMLNGQVLDVMGLRPISHVKEEWRHNRVKKILPERLKKDWAGPWCGKTTPKRAKVMAAKIAEHFGLTNK